jgi:hypothetical protein
MSRLLVRPFKEEFGDIFNRLKRGTEVVDRAAMATQLLRAEESSQGKRLPSCNLDQCSQSN